jgi:hypothetical protein
MALLPLDVRRTPPRIFVGGTTFNWEVILQACCVETSLTATAIRIDLGLEAS